MQTQKIKRKKEPLKLGQTVRVIKLVKFLTQYRTVKECAQHLELSPKSVRRYLDLLVQLGFEIQVLNRYRHEYKVTNYKTYFEDVDKP